jgi:predicted transcriptional regulator
MHYYSTINSFSLECLKFAVHPSYLEVRFMGKNRDRLSIIAAILQATNVGSSKTRIMLRANLSYKLLEKYMDNAIRLGLIQPNNSGYTLTERGRDFLNRYKHFQDEYAQVEKKLRKLTEKRKLLEQLCQEKTAILQLQPIRNPGSIERKAATEPALR